MKYNETKIRAELAEIKANQPPEFLMTKEDFKKAVLDNLPKSTMCPIHELSMELSEGISKKGEPYRLYKCPADYCDQKLWTERDANTINAEVKDIESMLGIDRPAATPAEGLEKKQRFIKSQSDKRNDSITEAAIRRDAVMFSVAEMNAFLLTPNQTAEEKLVELHNKWMLYFETEYKGAKENE